MRRRAVLRVGAGLAGLGLAAPSIAGSAAGAGRAAYGPLGRRPLAGASDCRVSADGETCFVAARDGVAVVGLPGLEVLAELRPVAGDREDGPLAGIQDVALDGDRLLVPGPANRCPGALAGFALYDVGDPTAPAPMAFHETTFPVHNAALAGGRALLTAGTGLVVVDVTGDDPVEVGRWSPTDHDDRWGDVPPPLRVLHDVRVRGDLVVASLWDAGTWLLDVSEPAAVEVVGRAGGRSADALATVADDAVRTEALQPPGNHHSSALSADRSLLAVGAEAFDAEAGDGVGGPGGVDLYDVADPAAPVHLSTLPAPRTTDATRAGTWTTAHDFAFDGERLVSAWYQGGVRVHDVADPTDPVELAWWRRPDEAAFWTARPAAGDTFVATSTSLPDDTIAEAVYRFPTRAGEQADPPSLTGTPSTDAGPRGSGTAASPTVDPTPVESPTSSSSSTASPGQPGLGPMAAVGGLLGAAGLAAWRRWRRR